MEPARYKMGSLNPLMQGLQRVDDMRTMLALIATLYSAAAMAQANPPTGRRQAAGAVQPKDAQPKQVKATRTAGRQVDRSVRLQACLEIEDATKGRLDCYDAVIPPKPNPKAAKAKGVALPFPARKKTSELACFNSYAEGIPAAAEVLSRGRHQPYSAACVNPLLTGCRL